MHVTHACLSKWWECVGVCASPVGLASVLAGGEGERKVAAECCETEINLNPLVTNASCVCGLLHIYYSTRITYGKHCTQWPQVLSFWTFLRSACVEMFSCFFFFFLILHFTSSSSFVYRIRTSVTVTLNAMFMYFFRHSSAPVCAEVPTCARHGSALLLFAAFAADWCFWRIGFLKRTDEDVNVFAIDLYTTYNHT